MSKLRHNKPSSKRAIQLVKTTGERASFSLEKLKKSLRNSGADDELIKEVTNKVQAELYDGITTKEIYNRAFALLKRQKPVLASRYKLKKAIYELGPSGFPFEKFIDAILRFSGYTAETNVIVKGRCVAHEVDVVASKDNVQLLIECKFHSDPARYCDVKIPLYIKSRFDDIHANEYTANNHQKGWVVTNTRFTKDALAYGKCVGLYLLSWDHPKGDSLKERNDRLGLYPITVSTVLTQYEKDFLLSRDIVL
ncbi:MAG: ATPase, partial [Croceitalea sp.]|nr:ATPase [Croceitalea sp.]